MSGIQKSNEILPLSTVLHTKSSHRQIFEKDTSPYRAHAPRGGLDQSGRRRSGKILASDLPALPRPGLWRRREIEGRPEAVGADRRRRRWYGEPMKAGDWAWRSHSGLLTPAVPLRCSIENPWRGPERRAVGRTRRRQPAPSDPYPHLARIPAPQSRSGQRLAGAEGGMMKRPVAAVAPHRGLPHLSGQYRSEFGQLLRVFSTDEIALRLHPPRTSGAPVGSKDFDSLKRPAAPLAIRACRTHQVRSFAIR
jgi:hypothetical protein